MRRAARARTPDWPRYRTSYANNKPKSIGGNGQTSTFEYGPSGQYWKQVATYSNGTETSTYIGGVMEIVASTATGITSYRHHIMANGRTVAIYNRGSNGANNTVYPLSDHLGGVESITDSSGAIIVKESFDPWGKRRGSNWVGLPSSGDLTNIANATRRGYTGHTMLDNVGLVHMNGRVYDPVLGRFLSADPYIQFEDDTQSWNRYTYVLNNPLSFTDPSGYFLKGLFRSIKKFIKKYWKPIVAIIAAVVTYGAASGWIAAHAANSAVASTLAAGATAEGAGMAGIAAYTAATTAVSTAAIAGAAAGAVAGAITGGWKGAAAGLVTGGLLGGIAGRFGNTWNASRVVAEGAAGGIGSSIQGGNFWDGFKIAGGFSLLRWGAYAMRQAMIEQSCTPEGNLNCTGQSVGTEFDGDSPTKIGGGRLPMLLRNWLGVRPSWLGGNQGEGGMFFGRTYAVGGFLDRLIESYAGPHDWLSSFRYGYQGNLIPYNFFGRTIYELYSAAAIVPATPFAIATAFQSSAFVPAFVGQSRGE